MKKIAFSLTALALGLAAMTAQAQERIRVGFMSPVTGPQAANGVDNRDGVLLAIKEINAKGVKIGGKPVVFELDINDDGADPKQGVDSCPVSVRQEDQVRHGPLQLGRDHARSPRAERLGHRGADRGLEPQITEMGYNNLFRIGASDNQLGTKMATYAAQDLKIKTVAVIDDRTAYGQGVAREFTEQAKRLGVKVVASEFTTDKATDFSSILTNIRASKADAVFYGGYSPQGGPLLKQMRALGISGPLLGGDGICSSETANLSQISGDLNTFCTQGGSMLDRSDKGQKFAQRYRAEYKRDPLTYAAAFYDGMHMLAAAIESTQSTDTKKVVQAIANGKYAGVTGEFSYDAKHDLKSSAVTVYTFKGKDVGAAQRASDRPRVQGPNVKAPAGVHRQGLFSCMPCSLKSAAARTHTTGIDRPAYGAVTSSKCSTLGGDWKNGPMTSRHWVNAADWRNPTVWASKDAHRTCSTTRPGLSWLA